MPLLSGLDQVAWRDVKHAYGPATDVPDLLRALVDPSSAAPSIARGAEENGRTVREHVIWTLWGNVFHQGTVWQATPKVIPFLFEILRAGPDDAALQTFLVSYLHHIAQGYPQDFFPQKLDPSGWPAGGEAEEEEDDDPYSDSKMAGYARACFLAVEEGLPHVMKKASSPHEDVALEAIACVASFKRPAPQTCDALLQVLAAEADGARPMRLAAALVALATLGEARAQAEAEKHVSSSDPVLAVHAACASALANAETMSDAALAILIAPLGERTEAPSPFTGTLGTLVSRCLARLPARHATRAVEAIARGLASAKPMTNFAQSEMLLTLAFGESRPPRLASELTALQRTALEAIAKDGTFSLTGGIWANYSLMLSHRGLPSDAEALRKWLAGSPIVGPGFGGFRSS